MAQINRVEVEIAGNNYILKSDKAREEILEVVEFVKKNIKKAENSSNRYNKTMQVTLAILNLAYDYFELEKECRDLNNKLAEVSKGLKADYNNLSLELNKTRAALSEARARLNNKAGKNNIRPRGTSK